MTTWKPFSHLRTQWRKKGWKDHSILQIRVMKQGADKSVPAVHQEKLADARMRQAMKKY